MSEKLKVSFNSPQCGWMSIGFEDAEREFHTTTAHAPHREALSNLLDALSNLLEKRGDAEPEFLIHWNRDPEEFDFRFRRDGERVNLEIWQYPTGNRHEDERKIVFSHEGEISEVCRAFYETFAQMYEDRDTDEFEQNWRQPFPFAAFERFRVACQNCQ